MLVMNIPKMSCSHCVQTITAALKAADPKAHVDIDLPSHTVKVESSVNAATLKQAVTEAGYAPA